MPAANESTARAAIAELATLISRHAPYDGVFPLQVPGVAALRASRVADEPTRAVQQASVCIVAQGAKIVAIGDTLYEYAGGQVAIFSIDLPVAARITRASEAAPYLTLRIALDPVKVATLAARVFPHELPSVSDQRAVYIGDADTAIIDAANRLLRSMAHPVDAELLAPLAVEEIIVRLLRSPMGARVAQIGRDESSLQQIAKAVSWLRENFDQPLDVATLAGLVNASVSTFHRQFKAATLMSPLQYQKALRLQEARRLMLTSMLDASAAARRVGYASPSQFSREYARFFGAAPIKDIRKLREQSSATT